MTMIIDKNSPLYKNFLKLKELFKSRTEADTKRLTDFLEVIGSTSTVDLNKSLNGIAISIEGIEHQVEYFKDQKGIVFYLDHNDEVIQIRTIVLEAKEVPDD